MRVYLLNLPFLANGKELPRFERCTRWQGCTTLGGTFWYPIWLSYATGVIEDAGHQARLLDAPAKNYALSAVTDDVTAFGPDIVVFESNFSTVKNDIDIVRLLKDEVDFVSVMVGPPASQFHREMLINDHIDVVARYEYELTIRDIAEAMDDGSGFEHVAGITYKRNGRIIENPDREFMSSEELDRIPFVTKVYKNHLDIRDYALSHTLHPMVQMLTGRGCPNRCTFCSWPATLMGNTYRMRSAANVVDELAFVETQLPAVKEVFIEDDTFTINKTRVKAICHEIEDRGLGIRWSCNARANLDFETMQMMKSAGCRLVDVGYESGSDTILKNIKKGITTEQSRAFTVDAKKAGLKILADFIFGLPGENRETIRTSIQFMKEIRPDLLQIAIATPLPGTAFYQWVVDHGYLAEPDPTKTIDEHGLQRCVISYPDLSCDEIISSMQSALRDYYFSVPYARVAARNILREGGLDELKGLLKSTKAFVRYLHRTS